MLIPIPFLLPRQDSGYIPSQTDQAADDGDSGNNKTTQIIIGVVVGGVAAIAITAGIIFFLVKKRKWDRIRKCEERLIDYQLATGYSSKQNSRSVTPEDYLNMMASPPATSTTTNTTMYPYGPGDIRAPGEGHQPGSRARGMSAPASTTLAASAEITTQGPSHDVPPPAYQTLHQQYDPSRYSQISTRFSSSFEIPRSSSSTVTGSGSGSGSGSGKRSTRGLSISGLLSGHRHGPGHTGTTTQSHGHSLSVPQSESSMWHQQQQYPQYQPGPAASGSGRNWPLSSSRTTTTITSTSSQSTNTSSRGSRAGSDPTGGERRGPRRPRPVLARLVTNL
ncbi:hypothetical protein BJX70DRAFT_355780 [Aspergillus crustosus]